MIIKQMEKRVNTDHQKGLDSNIKLDPPNEILKKVISSSKNILAIDDDENTHDATFDINAHMEDSHTSHIEQMQLENYSLRKRCKRLENIVSHLLETKGQPEEDVFHGSEILDINNNNPTTIINNPTEDGSHKQQQNTKLQSHASPLKSLQYSKTLLKTSTLRPLTIRTDENSFSSDSKTSEYSKSGREGNPNFPSGFSVKVLAESSSKQRSSPPTSLPRIHHPIYSLSNSQKEDSLLLEVRNTDQEITIERRKGELNKNLDVDEIRRSTTSSKSDQCRHEKESAKNSNLSHEEMEQMNEMFRSNYYAVGRNDTLDSRDGHRMNGISVPKKSPPFRLDRDKSLPTSVSPYHYSDYRQFRGHSPPSPTSTSSNSLFSSFFKRYPNKLYDSEFSERHAYEKHQHQQSFHRKDDLNSYDYKMATRHLHSEPLFQYSKRDIVEGYSERTHLQKLGMPSSSLSSGSSRRTHSGMRETHDIQHSSRHRFEPYKTLSPTKSVDGYHHSSSTTDASDLNRYSSDFYTKLPPKLHIVESQNENGVTLTWNATSNCDSSLVKYYQLFARELFGHKVGTMKRIGIVDALPLPMSCSIDKLKYNIKYKFAVCAIDVYGRYGKMSNFTGKFELKPKGPQQHQQQLTKGPQDSSSTEDLELEIVV